MHTIIYGYRSVSCLLAVLLLAVTFSVQAGDSAAGQRKARPCLGCHDVSDFAEMDVEEITAELKAVVAGEKSHPQLPVSLTDEDLADIAAYFAAANMPAAE